MAKVLDLLIQDCYRTTDCKIFDSLEEARSWQTLLECRGNYDIIPMVNKDGDTMDFDSMLEWMKQRKDLVRRMVALL